MDTPQTITHVSLCAGYGGIDLGLKRAIPNLRTIAFSEIEAFACANLVSKMEAGLLDPAPIWTDLKTFPWAEFRDRVDILSGGYPCQPFSAAGKRQGADDPRHLWPYIATGIIRMQPRVCFFENVEGHITLGLRDVLHDLAGMGYRTTWGIFSASEVGAPHQRKRVFILAYRDGERGQLPDWWRVAAEQVPVGYGETWRDGQWPSRPGQPQFAWEPPRVVADARCRKHSGRQIGEGTIGGASCELGEANELLEDAKRIGRPGGSDGDAGWMRGEIQTAGSCGGRTKAIGNSSSKRCEQDALLRGEQQPSWIGEEYRIGIAEAMGNADHGRLASCLNAGSGTEAAGRGESNIEQAESREIESNVGLHIDESSFGVGDTKLSGLSHQELAEICHWMVASDNRTDELRLLGNGVVPATAERAFRTLSEELLLTR